MTAPLHPGGVFHAKRYGSARGRRSGPQSQAERFSAARLLSKSATDIVSPVVYPRKRANRTSSGSVVVLITAPKALAGSIAPAIYPRKCSHWAIIQSTLNRSRLTRAKALADLIAPVVDPLIRTYRASCLSCSERRRYKNGDPNHRPMHDSISLPKIKLHAITSSYLTIDLIDAGAKGRPFASSAEIARSDMRPPFGLCRSASAREKGDSRA